MNKLTQHCSHITMKKQNKCNSHPPLSTAAMSSGHGEDSPYFDGWKAYNNNPFHPTLNPNGVIQMGLAENQLSFDLIQNWLKSHPEASICTQEGTNAFRDIAVFQDYHGLPAFRTAMARFMGRVRGGKAVFDPERIVMSGGATGAMETLIFCLADPGDAFLVPSPYYPAFDRDVRWRTGVQIIPVECSSSNGFQITRQALESSYKNSMEQNINVKGLILTNPSNPLGTVINPATLRDIVTFAKEKNIHLVCDEIYSATVFNVPDFTSVAEIVSQMDPQNVNMDLIHIIYSLSKDLGIPGFRIGIIYSYNDVVLACARRMSSFGLVSSQTQHFIAHMLSDDEFITKFLTESSRRLRARHEKFTTGLRRVGIECLPSNAGLFCWMDLRKLLDTEADELRLWRVIVEEVKLNVSPGSSFHCSEPGWFRVCFANMDDQTMDVALERIWAFVGRIIGPVERVGNRWKNAALKIGQLMRLSVEDDDSVMSPIG
ncbi:unnamed protein product [Rhodiola kirilowii]